MYKRTAILTLMVSMLMVSCAETKKASAKQQIKVDSKTEMKSVVKTSAFAKLFINDLNKELDKQNKSIQNYQPSKELMDKYPIQLFNNDYFIQGFVTTKNTLNRSELTKANISLGRAMGNKSTVRIPLKSFLQFLELEGIEYFEMNPKAELK